MAINKKGKITIPGITTPVTTQKSISNVPSELGGTQNKNTITQNTQPKIQTPVTATQGSYDPNKQGFQTNQGELYPTANPDFQPNPAPTEIVHVHPDGSKTVIRNGQTIELTAQEAQARNDIAMGKGGLLTNDINKLRNLENPSLQQFPQQTQPQGNVTAEEQGLLSLDAAKVGAGKILTSGPLVGAAIGAGIGSAVPVLGTAAGAVIGAFIGGYGSKLKSEANEKIAVTYNTLPLSKTLLNKDIATVNKATGVTRELAYEHFYNQLDAIDEARRQLVRDQQNELNKFLDVDTTKEVGKIDNFNAYQRQAMIDRMNYAMLNPDPNAVEQVDYSEYTDTIPSGETNLLGL